MPNSKTLTTGTTPYKNFIRNLSNQVYCSNKIYHNETEKIKVFYLEVNGNIYKIIQPKKQMTC